MALSDYIKTTVSTPAYEVPKAERGALLRRLQGARNSGDMQAYTGAIRPYAQAQLERNIADQPDPMARFNADYEARMNQYRRQQADAQSAMDLAKQRDIENRGRYERQIDIDQGRSLDESRDRLAGQGILRSGIAVDQAGDIGRGYQNRLDEFNRNMNLGTEERERAYNQTLRSIQDQIAAAQGDKAAKAAEVEEERAAQQGEMFGNLEQVLGQYAQGGLTGRQFQTALGGQRYQRMPDGTFQVISA